MDRDPMYKYWFTQNDKMIQVEKWLEMNTRPEFRLSVVMRAVPCLEYRLSRMVA